MTTTETQLTPEEAQFNIGVLSRIQGNFAAPEAAETVKHIHSIVAKCEAIVRTSQPMASAARTDSPSAETKPAGGRTGRKKS